VPRLPLLAAALLSAATAPALAQGPVTADAVVEVSPGRAVIADIIEVRATVTRIDATTRQVFVTGPNDMPYTITAGPEVQNFAQIKVGDQVVVRFIESVALTLLKDGKEVVGAHESAASARADAGQRPAGVRANQIEMVAEVTKVDAAAGLVTLKAPDHSFDLPVKDPAQLALIKVGDKVRAVLTEAMAVSVEPAAK
jgi:Cu/Ag efflux protein CusF